MPAILTDRVTRLKFLYGQSKHSGGQSFQLEGS